MVQEQRIGDGTVYFWRKQSSKFEKNPACNSSKHNSREVQLQGCWNVMSYPWNLMNEWLREGWNVPDKASEHCFWDLITGVSYTIFVNLL